MGALVASREVLDGLTKEVLRYSDLYVSSDPGSLILLSEAFGPDFIERNAKGRLQVLASTLRGLVVERNPLYGYYLPYLYVLGLRVEPKLEEVARRTVLELVERFREGSYGELDSWVSKSRALRKEPRKFLVAAALSAKYLVELSEKPTWRELAELYSREVFDSLVGRVRAGKLDPVGLAALLVLREHVNEVRRRRGLPVYGLPQGASWGALLRRVGSAGEITKASVAALLYDLYTSPYADPDARTTFLQLASSVLLDKLSVELTDRARESEKDAELYLKYYEVDSLVPTPGLDEVEYALLARFLRILKEAHIHIPICGLSEFVSKYYHIPESLLRVSLLITYIKLWLRRIALRVYIFLMENIIRILIPALVSTISSTSLSLLNVEPKTTLVFGLSTFFAVLLITIFTKLAEKLPRPRKLEVHLAGIRSRVAEISKDVEQTRLRLRYFKWYVELPHRNHSLS